MVLISEYYYFPTIYSATSIPPEVLVIIVGEVVKNFTLVHREYPA